MRDHNEDSVLERPDLDLWVVADGMGGHAAGDVASSLITTKLGELDSVSSLPRMCDDVEQALHAVNRELRERGRGNGNRMMGSTVVFAIVKQGYLLCGWAGDSRAYLYREGGLSQISTDHSHVEELIARGELTPEQAVDHPQANVVTRAVGGEPRLMIDYTVHEVQEGDLFLLCSDGLNKELADDEIGAILAQSEDLGGCADKLIDEALDRGGHDNTSVVLIAVDELSDDEDIDDEAGGEPTPEDQEQRPAQS